MIQVQEVVVTDLSKRGNGKDETSPVRSILEVYTKEGELLAAHDSQGNFSIEQLLDFAKVCRENPETSIATIYKSWANAGK